MTPEEPAPSGPEETRRFARRASRGTAAVQRERIHARLVTVLPGGMICQEVEDDLGLMHQSASARLSELSKAGRIVDSGTTRRTRSGCPATVWRAVLPGDAGEETQLRLFPEEKQRGSGPDGD